MKKKFSLSFVIKGFIPITLLDWPGKIASLVFVGGCNFRCPFCYNVDLVLRPEKLPSISEGEIFEFLKKKKKWVDGVVIGGGEPTLYPQLLDFCQKVKDSGFLVQIQTNGTNPTLILNLISQGLVDYLAMDIKGPLEKYDQITRVKVDKKKIKESIDLVKKASVESEFRTTVVPGLITKEDIDKIGRRMGPNCKIPYYLQQFRNEKTLDPKFKKVEPYTQKELEEMLKIAKKYFKKVELRGV